MSAQQSAPSALADSERAVEIRIHGVGGSTPEGLLGEDHPHNAEPVPGAGDARCGVWARVREPNTQGFVWGPLTSQSPFQALWIVLFPFTLLNAAGWMHERVSGSKDRKVTSVRFVIRILGITLTAIWVLWLSVIVIDLLAHQAARDVRLVSPQVRAIVATVAVAAVMGGLCLVARVTQRSFEHRRPPIGATGGSAQSRRRRRISDHEDLSSPSFFDHPDDSYRLLVEHALVIAAVAILAGWRAFQRAGDGGSLDFGGGITALVAVQFVLLGVLFLLTVSPLDWHRRWRVAGPAMAATAALMLSNGFFAGLALALRRSFDLTDVPLGSEMAFLDVFSLVAVATLLLTAAGWVLPFFLGQDDADDLPKDQRKRVGRRRRIARAFRHVDLPVSIGALGMLVVGAAVATRRIDWSGWNPWDWSVKTGGRIRWAETIGATALPAAAMFVPAFIRGGVRSHATRRNVGNVWDVLSFWPRRFHPLAVRPYSERAVPILQEHILRLLERYPRVVISAHSQGSVLAYAALAGLPGPEKNDDRRRIHLVTYGSPLSRLHARFFPQYFSPEDHVRMRRQLGSWHNFYRLTDHIGQAVFDTTDELDPCDHILADPPAPARPPAGDQPEPGPQSPPLERDRGPSTTIAGHNDYRREPALKAHVRRSREGLAENPPPRPDPGFRPRRRMVSWFDPRMLAMTGFNAVSSEFFRTFLDKREVEILLPKRHDIKPAPEGSPVHVDYVADLGDAFDPTYAIAWHLAKETLEVRAGPGAGADQELERGRFLIMGGDQVYPAPTRERYQNQMVGPYSVALPGPPADDAPQLLVMPGNHDWYDGLTLFLQQFCAEDAIGGWRTPQSRSYFAVQLGHRWWLWGVDAGLGGQVDDLQRDYFKKLDVAHGSHIILCWSAPTWTKERRKPGGHALLQRFVSEIVEGVEGVEGVEAFKGHKSAVALYLTGDTHHFAHYQAEDTGEHWITAGGGGAFLHPTHNLPDPLPLPATDGTTKSLRLRDTWPDERDSRKILWRLALFPWHNGSFVAFMALVHLLLAWGVQGGVRQPPEGPASALRGLSWSAVSDGFVRNPICIVLGLLVVAGFTGLAIPPRREKRHRYRLAGVIHGAAHIALALVVIRYAGTLGWAPKPNTLFVLSFLTKVAIAGGVLSGVLVGLYLAITNLVLKMHDNEAFSALHLTGYKHFLRMEVREHELIIRVIGLKKVGRRWRRVPATADRPPCARSSEVQPTCVRTIRIPARKFSPEPKPALVGPSPPAAPNRQPLAEENPVPAESRPGWSSQSCPEKPSIPIPTARRRRVQRSPRS